MDQNREHPFHYYTQWYELWMRQTKAFFSSAEENLKNLLANHAAVDPEDHVQQINQWIESLKKQWKFDPLNEQQRAYEQYWNMMAKLCSDASDLLLQQWIKQFKKKEPIRNVRELYELWLNCCHEVYNKAMHSRQYQEAYGDLLNAAIHFWKTAAPK
jgi:hypothetical protein